MPDTVVPLLPTASLAAALAQLQRRLPDIKKSEVAEVQTQKGTYTYTYAGLAQISDAILPLMGELGLSFLARPTFRGDRYVLVCTLLHVSGDREDGEYLLPTSGTPQTVGSAITYGRRYTLCAMTGLAPEADDDAASAEQEARTQRGTAQRAQRQRPPTSGTGTAQRAARGDDGEITTGQVQKIVIAFEDLGVADRSARLDLTSKVAGRHLESVKDLNRAEAKGLIEHLEHAKSEPDPFAYLAEVGRARTEQTESPE